MSTETEYHWNLEQLIANLNELAAKHGKDLPCEIQGYEGEIYPLTRLDGVMEMDGVIHVVLSSIPEAEPPKPATRPA